MSSPIVETQEASTIKPCQKFEGHTHWVEGAIVYLPGGQQMMTCSIDGSLRVWNLKSGKQIGEDWRDGESGVSTIALSPDGKKVVSGSVDGGMRLWDIDTGKVIAKWAGHTARVTSMCWGRDGRRVVSGSIDGTVREWDVEKGETILGPIKTGHELLLGVVYSPDMAMFAAGGCDWPSTPDSEHPVKIWDTKTGKLVATLQGHTNSATCLAWTPDGKTLIHGSYDWSISMWNTSTWKQVAVLDGHTSEVNNIAISPNGRILASASADQTAQLWNLDNNQPITSPLHHANSVYIVSFSADGKLLATACSDNNGYLWDVSAILKEAGLDHLLLDKPDESLLAADATRRPVRQPIKVANQVPRGVFDDTHSSAPHRLHPISSPSRGSTLRSRLVSIFRPTHHDAHDAPSRPRPFHWLRDHLFSRPSGTDIELHEHPSAVVDVPYAKGKRRDASAREIRKPVPKLATANSLRPPNSTVAQQSSGAAQPQSPHPALSTSTAPPVVANTTSNTNPHATIRHASRWARFWLFICCTSPEYTDGHH